MKVIDVNRILGPLPHDDVPSRDAAGLRAELDRLRIDEAWVVRSQAVYGDPRGVPPVSEDRLLSVPVLIPGPLGTGDVPHVPVVRLCPAEHRFRLEYGGLRMMDTLIERNTVTMVGWDSLGASERRALYADWQELPPIVLTGTGYRSLHEVAELLAECEQVYVDTSTLCGHRQVEWVAENFGAHRVLFGTGAPVTDDAGPRFQLDHLELPAADVELIAAGNAERLLAEAR
ncbi:amidohydrolase family protein [Streptomyces sp. NPDC051940]|uniref:amidohydrolase family protein n=1 Tax=Streptomyces sp. NPDC051940 TaxID=3155675 RepID=UPI00342B8A47